MKKILGYTISLIGILILFLGLNKINLNLKILDNIPSTAIKIIGILLVGTGIFLLVSSPGKTSKLKEIPIYDKKGKNIVGYRRVK